ncbi:MAG: PHP domain-containing protein [Candidatus Omnitrophota bacterium]|nr:MAG: PHP domain-containing protein [Candidatus Omnitrophota bacterium]
MQTVKNCDLHIHSNFSDSDISVREIFKRARDARLSCISITDHDTIEGIEEARRCSAEFGIELIEGVEISSQYGDTEVHILGYFIDPANEKLRKELSKMKGLRTERLLAMADRLNASGIKVDKEELLAKVAGALPTRLHLGLYLVEKGVVKSLRQAFKKYLSPRCSVYVAHFRFPVKQAISLIKESGGLAFLAHPNILPDQSWIEKFAEEGLDGIEVRYPRLSAAKIALYSNIAAHCGLLRSGGSDAHGTFKDFTAVGAITVPYEWIEKMRIALDERRSRNEV